MPLDGDLYSIAPDSPASGGLAATTNNTIQDKTALLQNKVQEKVTALAGKQEMLTGLQDADTPILRGIGDIRETPTTGGRYDAVELQHGNHPYDMNGVVTKTPGQYEKTVTAMNAQKAEVARLVGKPVEQLTQQDMIDVGNMQQIQKLADLVRGKDEPRWEAPLVRNVGQANLTGHYKDEFGNRKDIPLNIPVNFVGGLGKDLGGSRDLGSIVNPQTGINVTDAAAVDSRQNAFASSQPVANNTQQPISNGVVLKSQYTIDDLNKAFAPSVPTRSWGEAASDTGKQVVVGSLNAVKNLADIYGVATGDHDNWVSQTMGDAAKWYGESYSPALKAAAQHKGSEVAKGKDELEKFWIATKENFKNPMLISQLVVESVPMMAVALAGGEAMAAAKLGIGATEGMLVAGAVQQGADMGQSVIDSFFDPQKVTQKDWDNNPKYQEYIKQGMDSLAAKNKIAVDTGRVVALASGLLSYGVNKFMPGGHSIESKLTGGKVGGLTKSTAGESATEVVEEGGGQIFQNTGQQQVTPGLDTFANVGQVSADAMAAGGATNVAIQVPGALASGKQALGEKYDNLMDNLDDGDNGKDSITPEGRKNRWDSALDVEVAPENRAAYTRDLARYAADEFVRSGDLEGDYKNNPMKIFEDATERIAKINQVSSEDAKDMIGRQLAKNVLDVTEQVDAKGNRAFSVDKAKGLLSKFVETMKGNKGAEDVLEKAFEDELAAKFEEVRTRLMKEGMNVDDLSNKGVLTKNELDNLEKTLASMKTLGSERLTKRAEAIGNELEARQERLGSEGTDGPNVPPKKTVQEVRNEIETLGFLTRGKKSLEQHTRDLDAYVVDRTADPKDRDQALGAIENFVGSRSGKIDVVNRGKIDANGFTFRSVGELKKFAAETYVDNKKIMKVVTETAAKLPEGSKERARLEKMAEHLQEVQKRMVEVQNEGGTVEQDKALLRKVGGWSTFISDAEHKAFEKYVDGYTKTHKETAQDETETELDEPKVEKATQYAEGDKARIAAEWSELDVKGISKIIQTHSLEELVSVFKEATVEQIEKFADAMSETYKEKFYKALGKSPTKENISKNEELSTPEEPTEEIEETPTEKEKEPETESEEPVKAETTETKEEIKEEPKSKTPSKEQVDEYRKLVEEAGKELEEMEARIKAGGQIIDETKESIKAAAEDKTKAKEVADKAKVEADKRHEEVKQLQEELKGLQGIVKDYREKMNKLYSKRKELRSQDKQITVLWKEQVAKADKLNDQYYKLQETIKNMDTKTRDPKTFRRIIDELTRRFMLGIQMLKGKLNKLLERWKEADAQVKETGKVKDVVRAELQEVVDAITKAEEEFARVKEQIDESKEEIQSRLDQSVTSSKVAYDEFKRLDSTYKELSDKLDSLKKSRDDKLATGPVLDMDGFYGLVDQAKGLRQAISHYKNEIARGFRAEIEEALGDAVKANGSKRSSLTARLFSGLDVMDLMPRIIRDNEKGVEKVQKAIETLKAFEDKRKRKLVVQNSGADNAVLEKLGLDKLFNDKSIEDKVKKAVHVSSVVALANMIDARRNKGEQLDKFVDGAFGNLWSKYAEDKPEEKQLKNLITSGKIVPIATFTRDAGRRLLEELEIKLDAKTMQDYDDAVNALGAIVVNNVLWQDGSQAQIAKGTLTLKDGEVVVKSGFNLDVELGEGNGINVLDISKLTSQMVEDIGNAGIVFEYAREQSDGVVSLKPITHKEDKTGRNTDVKIGKDAEKYLNEQGSKPWKFDKSFVALWEAIGKDVNVLKEMILGTKEELVKSTDAMEVESALAKYAADELDVERMMMAYELVGDKEFYLGWDYTVSGRNMINNRMINPQNSKISRFVVGMEGMRHTLEVSDGERTMLEHAILQAFDGDPDKKSDAEVRKALKKEGVELNIVNGKYEVTVSEKIEKLLSKGTVVSLQGIQKELGIHGAHLIHAYQALTLLKELQVNGKDVQTNLAVEADGITNGMATTTLQMGLQADTSSYYEKSGLYVDGLSKYKSHGEFKSDGGKDFYEAPVEATKTELGGMAELVEKVIGGEKKWRSYLKPLVMVYAYGASMKNITKNGSKDLVLKVLNNKELSIEEVHKQLEELGVENPKAAYKAEWVMDKEGNAKVRRNPSAKTAYVDEATLEVMARDVEGKIGGALAKAFGETFKPVTEYRRALKVVHQLNYLVFNHELSKELKELGVSKIGELSKEQMIKLTEKMVKDGIWYGSDTSLGTTQDYFKTQQALGTKGETITVMLPTKWAKYSNGKGEPAIMNRIIKEAASNVGAVGVVDVHNVDGATMIKGHITDVLNIFDALVMGTNFKDNKEQMEAINQAYVDINMNHSILGKAVERLLKNGEKLQEITSVKGQLALDTLADVKRIFAIGAKDDFKEKFDNGMDAIMETLLNVDAGRRELVGQKIDVKQYYISDALGGGKWDGSKPSGRFAVFSNDPEVAKTEQTRVGMMIEKLKNVALGLEDKRKEKSAIINKKEQANSKDVYTQKNIENLKDQLSC